MCGIWGYVQYILSGGKDINTLFNAFRQVQKRGPDRSDFKEINEFIKLFLGFHRLSIMDRSTYGDQPFTLELKESSHRSIYAICNGEIYNFKKLLELYQISHFMKSKSDCEFLPHLYSIIGFKSMMQQLRGEFAVCIIDINHTNDTIDIFIGRDQTAVRPVFIGMDEFGFAFSSILAGIVDIVDPTTIRQLNGSEIVHLYLKKDCLPKVETDVYHVLDERGINTDFMPNDDDIDCVKTDRAIVPQRVLTMIRNKFIEAVVIRLESDRPLGALLSGGLDSSLVVSIAADYLAKSGRRLRTFSIGIPGSTDKEYAEMVAVHCDTDHTHIEFSEQDFLDAIEDVIKCIESYDITTVRASVGQYLVSKWIHDNTDIRVLLIGDGSDELCAGYMYFHNAPTPYESHKENIELLNNIHFYDSLRADRCIAYNGIEARVPFLDHEFVDMWLSIPYEYRVPSMDESCNRRTEKWLLRKSFDIEQKLCGKMFLPKCILYRKKEAFSDGVSSVTRSWYQVIQESLESKYADDDFKDPSVQYHIVPPTKEALHYRLIFNGLFHPMAASILPARYWLPKWSGNAKDPSARTLLAYVE
jgi:asparagine synthase (glutamine-hydrolysing)